MLDAVLQKIPTKMLAYANFFFAIVTIVFEIVLLVIKKYREFEQPFATSAGAGIWCGVAFLVTGLIALKMKMNHRNQMWITLSYTFTVLSVGFALTLVCFSCADIHFWLHRFEYPKNRREEIRVEQSTIDQAIGLRSTMLAIGFVGMAVNYLLSIKIVNRNATNQQS